MLEGELAYETYSKTMKQLIFQEREMLAFKDLPLKMQQAWANVEMAITKQTLQIVSEEVQKETLETIKKERLDHLAQEPL